MCIKKFPSIITFTTAINVTYFYLMLSFLINKKEN